MLCVSSFVSSFSLIFLLLAERKNAAYIRRVNLFCMIIIITSMVMKMMVRVGEGLLSVSEYGDDEEDAQKLTNVNVKEKRS